jgi:riboflavin synthase
MFTGIITDVGTIEAIEQRGDLRVRISTAYDTTGVDIGASIACSGACLTVVQKGDGWFAVDISEESVTRTAPGRWVLGQRLNLERALKVGDELGGHIVTGHVDGIGEIVSVEPVGDSNRITIVAGPEVATYIAAKGSITLDGISLTVNEVADVNGSVQFTINVIPHTAQVTTFDTLKIGQHLNIEIDILARYLSRMQNRITQ